MTHNRPKSENRSPSAELRERSAWKKHLAGWGSYAAASGAALAMSTNASATIISGTSGATASLVHESAFVSTFKSVTVGGFPNGGYVRANVRGFASDSRQGTAHLFGHSLLFAETAAFVKKFASGAAIAVSAGHQSDRGGLRYVLNGVVHGAWGPGSVTGFVGFKTAVSGDLGWFKVKVADRNSDGYPDQVEIISWAYNNSGGGIDAGSTTAPTPEPNTAALCLLGLGAVGLLAWRRRRAEVSSK